jgi:hypothetical protein
MLPTKLEDFNTFISVLPGDCEYTPYWVGEDSRKPACKHPNGSNWFDDPVTPGNIGSMLPKGTKGIAINLMDQFLAIDEDDPIAADILQGYRTQNNLPELPETFTVWSGLPGRKARIYRVPVGHPIPHKSISNGTGKPPLEIRTGRHYQCVFGVHPVTKAYKNNGVYEFAELPISWAEFLQGLDPKKSDLSEPTDITQTLEKVKQILEFLYELDSEINPVSEESWVKVGQILNSIDSDVNGQAFQIWIDWSRTADGYQNEPEQTYLSKWQYFKPDRGLGIGSLVRWFELELKRLEGGAPAVGESEKIESVRTAIADIGETQPAEESEISRLEKALTAIAVQDLADEFDDRELEHQLIGLTTHQFKLDGIREWFAAIRGNLKIQADPETAIAELGKELELGKPRFDAGKIWREVVGVEVTAELEKVHRFSRIPLEFYLIGLLPFVSAFLPKKLVLTQGDRVTQLVIAIIFVAKSGSCKSEAVTHYMRVLKEMDDEAETENIKIRKQYIGMLKRWDKIDKERARAKNPDQYCNVITRIREFYDQESARYPWFDWADMESATDHDWLDWEPSDQIPLQPLRRFTDFTKESLIRISRDFPTAKFVNDVDEAEKLLSGGFVSHLKNQGGAGSALISVLNGDSIDKLTVGAGLERGRPLVSFVGGIQPGVYRKLSNGLVDNQGLTARIGFVNSPSIIATGSLIPTEFRSELRKIFESLGKIGNDSVTYSSEAFEIFNARRITWETQAQREPEGEYQAFLMKASWLTAKIAALLHCLQNRPRGEVFEPELIDPEISVEIIQTAIAIGDWLVENAMLFFQDVSNDLTSLDKDMVVKLKALIEKAKERGGSITFKELTRAGFSGKRLKSKEIRKLMELAVTMKQASYSPDTDTLSTI